MNYQLRKNLKQYLWGSLFFFGFLSVLILDLSSRDELITEYTKQEIIKEMRSEVGSHVSFQEYQAIKEISREREI